MSLACVRFAAFPERCAPNGFLRERADPGPRYNMSGLGSRAAAHIRRHRSRGALRRLWRAAVRRSADFGATSAREDSDFRSGYEPDRPLKRNVLAARSGDRRRQRDAVASTQRLGFWWSRTRSETSGLDCRARGCATLPNGSTGRHRERDIAPLRRQALRYRCRRLTMPLFPLRISRSDRFGLYRRAFA